MILDTVPPASVTVTMLSKSVRYNLVNPPIFESQLLAIPPENETHAICYSFIFIPVKDYACTVPPE
jgi:hypothetical protein